MIKQLKMLIVASIGVIVSMQLYFLTRDFYLFFAGKHYETSLIKNPLSLLLLVQDVAAIGVFVGLLLLALHVVYEQKNNVLSVVGSSCLFVSFLVYIMTYFF